MRSSKIFIRKILDFCGLNNPSDYEKTVRRLSYVPFVRMFSKEISRQRWIRKKYMKFAKDQKEYIYMSCARYLNINRRLKGVYLEFGSHEGNTILLAHESFSKLFDMEYIAFDSFEGLPTISEDSIDKTDLFFSGNLVTSEKNFIKKVTRKGRIPKKKLLTMKGFYENSLTTDVKVMLEAKEILVVMIDCDLYESTKTVLDFLTPILKPGVIIIFDDWNCYDARNDRGERLAFSNWIQNNPQLKFTDFVTTGESKSFILSDLNNA